MNGMIGSSGTTRRPSFLVMAVPCVGGLRCVKVGIGGELGHITGGLSPDLHRNCGKGCGNRSRNARESASFRRSDRFAPRWCEVREACRERDCRLYLVERRFAPGRFDGSSARDANLSDSTSGRNIHRTSSVIPCTSSSPINCRPPRSDCSRALQAAPSTPKPAARPPTSRAISPMPTPSSSAARRPSTRR